MGQSGEKRNDKKARYCQTGDIKAANYMSRKLSVPAENKETGTNKLAGKFFALV